MKKEFNADIMRKVFNGLLLTTKESSQLLGGQDKGTTPNTPGNIGSGDVNAPTEANGELPTTVTYGPCPANCLKSWADICHGTGWMG